MYVCRLIILTFYILLAAEFQLKSSSSSAAAAAAAAQISALKVQLHAKKISQYNDTKYVQQIMRLSKSAEIHNYMRPDVDACDDFFQFACGNWPKINPAHTDSPHETNVYGLLTSAYNRKLLNLLKQTPNTYDDDDDNSSGDTVTDVKVKNYFMSCLNLKKIKKHKYTMKLREIIDEFGQMPVLLKPGVWQPDDFDWQSTLGKIQNKYGVDIIMTLAIRPDFGNKTQNKIFIGQPDLRLQTKSMYTNEATEWHRRSYKQEIQKNLELFLNVPTERAEKTAKEILDFEIKLAHGFLDRKLIKSVMSEAKLRTLDELVELYGPVINIKKYTETAIGYELNDTIYEYGLSFFPNLCKVINETEKEQLANYIMYQLVVGFFFNTQLPLNKRENKCLTTTKFFFAKVLDSMIYRKYNNVGTSRDINFMWHKLKTTFKSELESSDKIKWMSLMTRKLALEKLDSMRLEINSYENANFTEEFEEVDTNADDYIENIKKLLIFNTRVAIKGLKELPKPTEAAVALSFTPAYLTQENLIKIPVALLQPNFLWSDFYPNAIKFGTLGYLVSHELIHGFDDIGCQYDLNGIENNWWDANTTSAFNAHASCFKRQYARYRYGGKYLPESALQSENIADNGAVRIAYSAYKKWLADNEHSENDDMATEWNGSQIANDDQKIKKQTDIFEMEQLPNINYSNKQLFFISFAQFWCNDVNEFFKDKVSLVDLHAPAKFRVIGSLANFDEFSKEFQCAKGTTMNPEQKCQIY